MGFHWTCPYCDRDTTITDTYQTGEFRLALESANGHRKFVHSLVVCPNPKCRNFSLTLQMYPSKYVQTTNGGGYWQDGKLAQRWTLVPPSSAKVFPDYVPQAIRTDYEEACTIRDLSPKASATLSRRCLQGMIRDFWGISKARLIEEVEALRDKTDPETWEAIDAVRKIGNIGAHMEKDINLIVDVDASEAQQLIGLIELLMKDWYIAKHQRQERLAAIVELRDAKQASKKP